MYNNYEVFVDVNFHVFVDLLHYVLKSFTALLRKQRSAHTYAWFYLLQPIPNLWAGRGNDPAACSHRQTHVNPAKARTTYNCTYSMSRVGRLKG